MPVELNALDQVWSGLVLVLGSILTIGSIVALVLCVLGGWLGAFEQRWVSRDSSRASSIRRLKI